MKIYTKEEFQIFIIGNYIFNHDGLDDMVIDHSSYFGVYNIDNKMLKIIEEKHKDYITTYYKEITSDYFIDILIAQDRIHYLNSECFLDSLLENGYNIIGGRYFIPKHRIKFDYFVNRMTDTLESLKLRWKYEFEPLLKKIKTPEQVKQEVTVSRIAFGVEDYEDSQIAGTIAMMKRTNVYNYLINSYYAQFIHLIGSIVEDSFIKGMKDKGADINNFDRNVVYNYVFEKTKKKYEEIPNHEFYTKFIVFWNFLKHNNKTAFEEVKKICPEYLLHSQKFLEYGHSSQNYIRVDEEIIIEMLENLKKFFISFSRFVFDEKYNEAKWNYFDYFVEEAYNTYKWHMMPT